MHRDPLHTLIHLVATEANPHQLVLRLVADSALLKEAQRLCRIVYRDGLVPDGRLTEFCRTSQIPPDFFRERLQLVARILNLIPYEQNYYEILGVNRHAGQQKIKQAFRRLSFASHPDTNPDDPNAAERFHNIQQAYEVLSHDRLRHRYDRNLESHVWDEESSQREEAENPARLREWYKTWPIVLLFALLVVMTFAIDYHQQWQAERSYTGTKMPSAGIGNNQSSPSSSVTPDPGNKDTTRKSASIALLERGTGNVIPRTPAGTSESKSTPETAPIGDTSGSAKEFSPENKVESAERQNPVSPKTSEIDSSGSVKTTQQMPSPRIDSPPPAKGESDRQQLAEKSKEPAAASSKMQPAASAATPNRSEVSERKVLTEKLDREIRTFLFHYTSTYETRNTSAFLHFFETDAIENGRPIQELIPFYQANFKRAEKLRYRINVGRWEMGEGEVMVDGSFNLSVQFGEEAPVESTGSIQLTLVRRGGDFGVKRLNYSFKESRKIAD
jgi:curved DNA-binding protein CbpA